MTTLLEPTLTKITPPTLYNIQLQDLGISVCLGAMIVIGAVATRYMSGQELAAKMKSKQPFLLLPKPVTKDIAEGIAKELDCKPTPCECGHFVSCKVVGNA
jgi:hypothetical protein